MNDRIKQLAEQAVTRFDQDMHGSMEPEELGRWVRYGDLAKFAELIVRECIGLFVDPYQTYTGAYIEAKIEEHFGVEE